MMCSGRAYFAGKEKQIMITEKILNELNGIIQTQSDAMLAKQSSVFSANYKNRSGRLSAFLSTRPRVELGKIIIPYPKYIRFLDMKDVRWQGERLYKKDHYAPIYNKYVYGYLKIGVWRKLNSTIPKQMFRILEQKLQAENAKK